MTAEGGLIVHLSGAGVPKGGLGVVERGSDDCHPWYPIPGKGAVKRRSTRDTGESDNGSTGVGMRPVMVGATVDPARGHGRSCRRNGRAGGLRRSGSPSE